MNFVHDFGGLLVACAAAGALILGMNSLSAVLDPAPVYAPGVYSAQTRGFQAMTVTVTIGDDGRISDLTVDAPDETPTIGGAAMETLMQQVIAAQGSAIDGVSGATLTTNGVKDGVSQALAQAAS